MNKNTLYLFMNYWTKYKYKDSAVSWGESQWPKTFCRWITNTKKHQSKNSDTLRNGFNTITCVSDRKHCTIYYICNWNESYQNSFSSNDVMIIFLKTSTVLLYMSLII